MISPAIHPLLDQQIQHAGIAAAVLRLDQIHPVVSGNKIFKLKPYLDLAIMKGYKEIISFGGSHSNHLVALAYACKQVSLKCTGIVRGEKSDTLSPALLDCSSYGMKIEYVDRPTYRKLNRNYTSLQSNQSLVVAEGGYGKPGMLGASTIMQLEGVSQFDVILASCGTGTMGAGLIHGSQSHQQIHLVSALKNNRTIVQEISELIPFEPKKATVHFGYDMGGYAKSNSILIDFMNQFHEVQGIPSDIVYTGKLFYAFYQMIQNRQFKKGTSVLIIHSGGLQGNRSLKNGILRF